MELVLESLVEIGFINPLKAQTDMNERLSNIFSLRIVEYINTITTHN